jgi:hypothetical protein
MTDGQSASLSSNKTSIWGLRPDFYYCRTVAGLLMWDGTGVYNCCWFGQRSRSRVRVPWDSRPHLTVSDSRLPFSSPPTTRGATLEVLTPPPHKIPLLVKVRVTLRVAFSSARTTQHRKHSPAIVVEACYHVVA